MARRIQRKLMHFLVAIIMLNFGHSFCPGLVPRAELVTEPLPHSAVVDWQWPVALEHGRSAAAMIGPDPVPS